MGVGTTEIILLISVWGLALRLIVKNRRKKERATRQNAQNKGKAGRLYLVAFILCGILVIMVLVVLQENNIVTPRSFTLGSHADDVLTIQGQPASISRYSDREIWEYGYSGGISSTVVISVPERQVIEWYNIAGNLKVFLSPGPNITDDMSFMEGSHADDVLRLQGTPDIIQRNSDYEIWGYGYSAVVIHLPERQVTHWTNVGNLKVNLSEGPNVTNDISFTKGSYADDILRLQGTPFSINCSDSRFITNVLRPNNLLELCYRYADRVYIVMDQEDAKMELSGSWKVVLWDNKSGSLNVRFASLSSAESNEFFFTYGSHANDVLRIQGSPGSKLNLSAEEWWAYGGNSYVKISLSDRRVIGWYNTGNNLKVRE